jgi:hypothetical protein
MGQKFANRLKRGVLGAAAVMLLAPSVTARSGAYLDTFDIYFGGIRAGELALDVTFDEGGYQAKSNLTSAGVVGFFYDASYEAEATGALPSSVKPRPRMFAAKSAFGGDRQDVTIHFGLTGPKKVEADPPYKKKDYEIEPTAQLGAIDPLSAAVALIAPTPPEELCARKVTVFDGRHRIDIRLDAPREQAGKIRCDAVFSRVAGFRPKDMKKQTDFPFRVYFEPWEDGLARLSQIVVETSYGLATANRKE